MGRSVSNEKKSWTDAYFGVCHEDNSSKLLNIKPRALFSEEQTKTVSLSPCSSFENDYSLDECNENMPQHGNINMSDSFYNIVGNDRPKEERGVKDVHFEIEGSFSSPKLNTRKLKIPPAPKKIKKKRFFII